MSTDNLVKEGTLISNVFDISEVFRLLERGYNIYEVCQKLNYNRHELIAIIKSSPELLERATEARRQGADALVATYKDTLMKELAVASDSKDRIALIKELGTHIRWEAQSVHAGTYATKLIQEHVGELKHKHNVKLTPEQLKAMAEEVLALGGTDFSDPRKEPSENATVQ